MMAYLRAAAAAGAALAGLAPVVAHAGGERFGQLPLHRPAAAALRLQRADRPLRERAGWSTSCRPASP